MAFSGWSADGHANLLLLDNYHFSGKGNDRISLAVCDWGDLPYWPKAHPLNAEWKKQISECPDKKLFGIYVLPKEGLSIKFYPEIK
jgi:hypothetical protein